jgi:cytochrome c-type biogenesis protein CcsB
MMLYQRLKVSLQPEGVHNFAAELAEYQKALPLARKLSQSDEEGSPADREAIKGLAGPVRSFQLMEQYAYPLIVPPVPGADRNDWQNAGASLINSLRTGELHPAMTNYAAIASAYHAGNADAFNQSVASYKAWLESNFSRETAKARAEFYFNTIKAFLHATIIYICAFVLALGAVVFLSLSPAWSESFRRSAFYLVVLAAVVHTAGLIFRMVLEGRPPVTNLYSSAVFIGWGVAIVGIILERMYRVAIGSIVGAFAGFVTLIIAHNLAIGSDTMEMLRAVLDTNFWLATHVVVITLGYSACFAAGLLAVLYIFLGLFSPLLAKSVAGPEAPKAEGAPLQVGQALSRMVYGILCFALLFSFLGTVLGGIWADQSWGRFWGWDPKENGALLIVLWCAITLHARWAGMVQERGFMNMAIFGNIVTAWSWFGVNMLNVGLHSYGFMDAAFLWLLIFVVSQVFIILLGCLPLTVWRSFRPPVKASPGRSQGPGRSPAPATT